MTKTTSAVTTDTGGRRIGAIILLSWWKLLGQLFHAAREHSWTTRPPCCEQLNLSCSRANPLVQLPGRWDKTTSSSVDVPGAHLPPSCLGAWRRRRSSSWSGWAPSFVVVMLCVVNCSGSGGEVSAFWMSRLVHILREVTTRTPLWLFYQWVIFQLLSFSSENAWQNHYGSHHRIKGSERSGYLSEHLKTAFSHGYCKWAITAVQSSVGRIQKHENNWNQFNVLCFTNKCALEKTFYQAQWSSLPVCENMQD